MPSDADPNRCQVIPVAGGGDGDGDDRSIWQLLKDNPRIIAYSICANTGSLLFGYDGLALSTIIALPAFA